ncbi:hypothetical protein [Hamadaea tsunoensis]|uniref:hypothetical protein n=1 Tax=Hamadaea tsunoensis TaxID=53368 RepID=UPI000488C164|nr:hypothetical protein [Hamadaea tsunoensis]
MSAFSVDSVGLERAPFPLSFSVREDAGCHVVHATAAQAEELADILARAAGGPAGGTIVVTEVATNSFLDERYEQWPVSRIAAEQGVTCTVHEFGALSTGVFGLGTEALILRPDDLGAFLAGWSPYELTLVGLPGTPTTEDLDEMGLAIGIADHSLANHGRAILPTLPGCRLWYSGHDDCYVWLECVDPAVPPAILSRLLALMAGSALTDDTNESTNSTDGTETHIPDADHAIATALIEENPRWVGSLAAATGNEVTIQLSATAAPWRLGDKLPARVDRTVRYDRTTTSWRAH